jgi:outer membrane protein with beta-barrel domain
MSLRKVIFAASLVILMSVVAPSRASADWLFTPFLGSTFGGSANIGGEGEDFKDEFERKLNYGASLAVMGGGALGFEIDFGYSPNFFGVSSDSSRIDLVGDGNVTTLMGNLILAAPLGSVRPYASGGIGLMRAKVDDPGGFFDKVSTSDLGLDAGVGLMFMSGSIGLRGDLRYFRSLQDNDPNGVDFALGDFRFWRGTVGVTFKF